LDGKRLTPERSQKLRNHSPDGFNAGYLGSGPAQLALAVLLACGWSDEEALKQYQRFKQEHIAKLEGDEFVHEFNAERWAVQVGSRRKNGLRGGLPGQLR